MTLQGSPFFEMSSAVWQMTASGTQQVPCFLWSLYVQETSAKLAKQMAEYAAVEADVDRMRKQVGCLDQQCQGQIQAQIRADPLCCGTAGCYTMHSCQGTLAGLVVAAGPPVQLTMQAAVWHSSACPQAWWHMLCTGQHQGECEQERQRVWKAQQRGC
jgi:hypothetical protein